MNARLKLQEHDWQLASLYGATKGPPESWNLLLGPGTIHATDGIRGTLRSMESDSRGEVHVLRERTESDQWSTCIVLASTSGSYDPVINNFSKLISLSRGKLRGNDIPEDIIEASTKEATEKFRHTRIERLKNFFWSLEHPLYFRAIPATVREPNLESGELVRFTNPRRLVYSLLPFTVTGARFYHQTEEEISLLAGSVILLIELLCSQHVIETPELLVKYMDEWAPYADPLGLLQAFQRIEMRHPLVIPAEIKEQLLPDSAKEVRDCLAAGQRQIKGRKGV